MIVGREELKRYLRNEHLDGPVLMDKSKWRVEERENEGDFSSYILTDTETNYSYVINRVFALEQISDDEFLAFRRAYMSTSGGTKYEYLKYCLYNNTLAVSYRVPSEYAKTNVNYADSLINDSSKKSNR